jgi:hypothetical protein
MTNTKNDTLQDLAVSIGASYSSGKNLPTLDPLIILTVGKIIFDVIIMIKKCYDTRNTATLSERLKYVGPVQKSILWLVVKRHTARTHLDSRLLMNLILSQSLTEEQLINLLGD